MSNVFTDRPMQRTTQTTRVFDGVLCFGGLDWWYHNRGHYDMQMMRELATHVPVVYVNSIGMRTPTAREGRMFFKRVVRKAKSISRGFVKVRDNFGVLSPFTPPGGSSSGLWRRILLHQVNSAMRRMNIRQPLLWVACPPAAAYASAIDKVGMAYQRTDRMETFPGVDENYIRQCDRALKRSADITFFVSTHLFESERKQCQAAAFVDHGADLDRFMEAGDHATDPADVASIARPRVGFIGGIDRHTFDPELFNAVVQRLDKMQFILVGGCSLSQDWCPNLGKNVHMLGRKPYEQVADYMAACDVLIMPWNHSDWIAACNPVKLKEYLAVGRPIVSTPFPELARFRGLVAAAQTPDAFAQAIEDAVSSPDIRLQQRKRVEGESWQAKCGAVLHQLSALGLTPAGRGAAAPAVDDPWASAGDSVGSPVPGAVPGAPDA